MWSRAPALHLQWHWRPRAGPEPWASRSVRGQGTRSTCAPHGGSGTSVSTPAAAHCSSSGTGCSAASVSVNGSVGASSSATASPTRDELALARGATARSPPGLKAGELASHATSINPSRCSDGEDNEPPSSEFLSAYDDDLPRGTRRVIRPARRTACRVAQTDGRPPTRSWQRTWLGLGLGVGLGLGLGFTPPTRSWQRTW